MKTPSVLAICLLVPCVSSANAQTVPSLAVTGIDSATPQPVSPVFTADFGRSPFSVQAYQGRSDPRLRSLLSGHGRSLFLTDPARSQADGSATPADDRNEMASPRTFPSAGTGSATQIVTTIAGLTRSAYGNGGAATAAYLGFPQGVAVDAAANFYISDTYNYQIRKVNAGTGVISAVAGTGQYGSEGNGQLGVNAQLSYVSRVAFDSMGNLYIVETGSGAVIREVNAVTGIISVVAGGGNSGYGDGGAATQAELDYPTAVAVDSAGNLYIADSDNYVIRKVSRSTGIISTVAGTPNSVGYFGDGGPATQAQLNFSNGVAVDANSNLYISDTNNNRIRLVSAATGIISTYAGNGTDGYSGDGGAAIDAQISRPLGIRLDAAGDLYVADAGNDVVRKITASTGIISTVAGNGKYGYSGDGGSAVQAEFGFPQDVAVDAAGNLYIADYSNQRIRRVDPTGVISTVAGTGLISPIDNGAAADTVPIATEPPDAVAVDAGGNVYFADPVDNIVREVRAADGTVSTVAGNGLAGYTGDGGPAASAELNNPTGLALDPAGNLYIGDTYNHVVRKVDRSTGVISTFAGNGTFTFGGNTGDGGPATSAALSNPFAVALDSFGNVYIADTYGFAVRKVNAQGIISTVAGNGQGYVGFGSNGDGGPATSAELGDTYALAVDAQGNLYIGDEFNWVVREINVSTGIITRVVGNGQFGESGDGGPALTASIEYVYGLSFDASGNLYIADSAAIRVVNTSGIIGTVAGQGGYGYSGDGGPVAAAQVSPIGVAIDSASNIYFADLEGKRIRKISTGVPQAPAATPVMTPVAGSYGSSQTVTLSDSTPGAQILFTLNGITPNLGYSSLYTAPLSLVGTVTVSAIAIAPGYSTSAATSTSYTFPAAATTSPAFTPVFMPAGGTYAGPQSVTIIDATPDATIYYTTDGTAPSTSSTQYSGPITVSGNETIQAFATASGYTNSPVASASYVITTSTITSALQFIPVTPCRVVDTRNPDGPFGGPELGPGASREFDIPQSACNIPSTAVAYSLNVTVVPNASLNYLTLWPSGQPQPYVSTLNSDGRVKANAAITPAGTNSGVSVFVSDASQVILDIDGYFVLAGTASALAFYPVMQCRIADTRNATGPLGGPSLAGNTSRAFPIQSSSCGLPSTAQAYSLNVTAVPHSTLNYLTAWPTGETQPYVSTLNSSTGTVTANAAIVPAGSGGDVSIYAYDDTDVILDVSGYFAPPSTGGLSLYTTMPCRVIDTRPNAFSWILPVGVEASACAPPATAQAYVLNATVVPVVFLNYLTLWPDGGSQPYVSTLNAEDGAITSNMAIVPTNNGSIDAFADSTTSLILDISSYFAP